MNDHSDLKSAAPSRGRGRTTGVELERPDPGPPLERALYEVRRVIVGQDEMLERVFVALVAGGHVLLEGVPGLAKTLTVKTLAAVLGGTFRRIQFTPDLVPADLVGTRVLRPDTAEFEVELGPVFCHVLLADEINRAPAKVQSALLEVMQEGQVTIGRESFAVPDPFLVLATQNPIESEGTYALPEAQVDRFMMKVAVDYPEERDERLVVERSLVGAPEIRPALDIDALLGLRASLDDVYVDPTVIDHAVELAGATRRPSGSGLAELDPYVDFGASPRASIALVHAARAAALLRGRTYALAEDVRDFAADVLRHRVVLSYDALADGVSAERIVAEVLGAVAPPEERLGRHREAA